MNSKIKLKLVKELFFQRGARILIGAKVLKRGLEFSK